jgi:ribonuclease G
VSRELVVSSTHHETRLAIIDDDQLVEIYIERESDQGLAGSIHKGRVTRVLPGMQSAFVDVGLDRDAFLYVSDFLDTTSDLEDGEDEIASAKPKPSPTSQAADEQAALPEAKQLSGSGSSTEGATERDERRGSRERGGRRRRSRRGRRRGGRGPNGSEAGAAREGLPEAKYAAVPAPEREAGEKSETVPGKNNEPEVENEFELLPGESLAKYESGEGDVAADAPRMDSSDRSDEDEASEVREPLPVVEAAQQRESDQEDSSDAAGSDEEGSDQAASLTASNEDQSDDDDGSTDDDDADFEDDDDQDDIDDSDDSDDSDDFDDSDDDAEDDEDGQGIDFSQHLAEAERIAALVEEQEEDNPAEGEIDADAEGEQDEESKEPAAAGRDEQEQEVVEFRSDAYEADQDDAHEEPSREETEVQLDGSPEDTQEEKPSIPGTPADGPDEQAAAAVSADPDDHGSVVPGQPETARVRGDRSGPQNFQRRGRRGRRRGGRSRDRDRDRDRQPRPQRFREPSPSKVAVASAEIPSGGKITDLLQKGNEILVQIAKEPLGKKGARITSHIALPGRYLVYMPTVDHAGVSRKIGTFDERRRLRDIVRTHRTGMPGGFIVRTAGAGMPEEEIRGDMLFLYNLWLDIRQKAEDRGNPGLVHQDLDIVERTLRDQLDEDYKAIWVDSEDEYERMLRFVERFQPSLLSKVKLYTRRRPIFDEFNVTNALEKAMRPKVWLKSGGYIVINQTEALVAVDVNTGKYVGKSDRLEDTIVNTNLEAAKEVVRQIRLRDLGGIIVVDFIDMDDRKNRQKVLLELERAMESDPAPSKSLAFNDFGLVAITRKRVKQSLERTLCSSCPTCNGSGHLKSVTTVVFEILKEANKLVPGMDPQKDITLRVNPEIGRELKSRKNNYLQELETILRSHIVVRSDLSLRRENFDIN